MTGNNRPFPYCDGPYCDEAGIYLHLPEPFADKRFCASCLRLYVYQGKPMEQLGPPKPVKIADILPFTPKK